MNTARLASATGSSTFDYGPGGNRYQQVATEGGNSTTTTYIAGGLFEVVATATTTEYRHAIFADGQVIAVHTIDQGGSASTSYLHYDPLGSVDDVQGSTSAAGGRKPGAATLTDDQGAVIQKMSFDAFGLRRDAGNWTYDLSSSQIAPLTGLTNRGYTDQEQLDNVALVDLNGRVYDPTVGRFISADPTVPDPLYSQAFNRYSYVNDNPLSLSDPSGYFSTDAVLGVVAAIVVDVACDGTCTGMTTAFLSGAAGGFVGSGGNLQTGVESGLEAMAFNFAGDHIGWGTTAGDLFAKSTVEGLVGGAFSEAGGGRFSDGFLGAFSSSELSPVIGGIGGTTNSVGYYSAAAISMRVVVSAVVGGTVSSMTGGNFGDGAVAAAMQRLYNDEQAKKAIGSISGYPQTGKNSWRAQDDAAFIKAAVTYDAKFGYKPGDRLYVSARLLKAWAMVESGGTKSAFLSDPLQVNNAGDWVAAKLKYTTLTGPNETMTPFISAKSALLWLHYKAGTIDILFEAFAQYNGNTRIYDYTNGLQHNLWYANKIFGICGCQ